jgi:hypothetical protein
MQDKAQKPAAPDFAAVAGRLTSNFALASATAIGFAVFCSTIFLYAYIRVFDSRLIWLVEYTDVLKVGLIAIAVASGFAFFVWMVVDDAYTWATKDDKGTKWNKWSWPVLIFVSMLAWLYDEYANPTAVGPRYVLIVNIHTSVFMLGVVTMRMVQFVHGLQNVTARGLFFVILLITLFVGSLGSSFGYYTRDGWTGWDQRIVLEGEILPSARLIMVTSRHAVVYADRATIVVPADDLKRITTPR